MIEDEDIWNLLRARSMIPRDAELTYMNVSETYRIVLRYCPDHVIAEIVENRRDKYGYLYRHDYVKAAENEMINRLIFEHQRLEIPRE
jgi:hypothetical protein